MTNDLVVQDVYSDRLQIKRGLTAESKPRSLEWGVNDVTEQPKGCWQWYNRRYVVVTDTPDHIDRGRTSQLNMGIDFLKDRHVEARKRIAVEKREAFKEDRKRIVENIRQHLKEEMAKIERYEATTRELENE